MEPVSAESLLNLNYLFKGLPSKTISSVAALATRRRVRKGSVVFAQGDEGDALYGVISGRIRISTSGAQGQEAFLSFMEPGDTFGEIAVMDGLKRSAGATAVEDSWLIMIRRADFLRLLEKEPRLAIHLLGLLCKRLRWTSQLVEESLFLDGQARLAKRLLVLAELHGRPIDDDQVELTISQDDLAHFLGTSRQIVNQHLREWQRQNWVKLRRGRIILTDSKALAELGHR